MRNFLTKCDDFFIDDIFKISPKFLFLQQRREIKAYLCSQFIVVVRASQNKTAARQAEQSSLIRYQRCKKLPSSCVVHAGAFSPLVRLAVGLSFSD